MSQFLHLCLTYKPGPITNTIKAGINLRKTYSVVVINAVFDTLTSVRNKASPSDNEWLELLRTDWFENLSDKKH